ncbi:hypothetical protein N665_0163s0082 [Sinapis alba]|nr:hypothetical protein N665_0163s0082 [Sinapis alba]
MEKPKKKDGVREVRLSLLQIDEEFNIFQEAFAVCENYSPPERFHPRDLYRLLENVGSPSGGSHLDCSSGWQPNKVYIPFLACGDLIGYDSDRSYPLPKEADGSSYQSLDPVEPPIAPPYKRALELKKASTQSIRDT